MDRQKGFLIILFIICILFLLSINIGASHSDDQTVQTPDWLTNLGGRMVSSQPLRVADLTPEPASCLQGEELVISAQSTCTFAIQKSDFTSRIVTLQLMRGASATIELTQEAILPVQESLTEKNSTTTAEFKVYPGKTQGVLSITCLDAGGAPACLIKLK